MTTALSLSNTERFSQVPDFASPPGPNYYPEAWEWMNQHHEELKKNCPPVVYNKILAVQKQVRDIAKKMGIVDHEHMQVDFPHMHSLNFSPAAERPAGFPGVILLPSLFMIQSSDIPPELKFKGPQDPKLQTEEYLDQFIKWAKEFIGAKNYEEKLLDRENLRIYLKLISDPTMEAKARNFLLEREVSHVFLQHPEKKAKEINEKQTWHLFVSIVLGLLIFLGFGIVLSLGVLKLILAFGMAAGAAAVNFQFLKMTHEWEVSKEQAKEADLQVTKISKDSKDAAIYVYETVRKHYQDLKTKPPEDIKEKILSYVLLDSKGSPRFFVNPFEPRPEERLAYLKA